MFDEYRKLIKEEYQIPDEIIDLVYQTKEKISPMLDHIDEIRKFNSLKVLKAFQSTNVQERHFIATTGYGNADQGRDKLQELFCTIFKCERAIVSPLLTSGTHTIIMGLMGLLRPHDTLLSISGPPYDTLITSLGLDGIERPGSISEFLINYDEVDLKDDFTFDIEKIKEKLINDPSVKVVHIQRSKGYIARPALTIKDIKEACEAVRSVRKDVFITVDNCYGEFTETMEPTEVGADVIMGSMIKNPGAGIAPTGGYICGTKRAIDIIETRFTTPSMGTEIGSYAYGYRNFFQGLYLSPTIVATALKGTVLITQIFSDMGYPVSPDNDHVRSDIAQSIIFPDKDELIAFIRSVQRSSPIDSGAVPYPDMQAGYEDPIIMASGSFIQGSTIELSADAPIREPYTAYFQGGLTDESIELAVMLALKDIREKKGPVR